MANKRTIPLRDGEYKNLIGVLMNGCTYQDPISGKNRTLRSNMVVAYALITQVALGVRICDVLRLTMDHFQERGDGAWQLCKDFVEQKTGKERNFVISEKFYIELLKYQSEMGIKRSELLFQVSERTIERRIQFACDALKVTDPDKRNKYIDISTHSFRKYAAMAVWVKSGKDIEYVRKYLQHSSIVTSQRYIGVNEERFEEIIMQCNMGDGWKQHRIEQSVRMEELNNLF